MNCDRQNISVASFDVKRMFNKKKHKPRFIHYGTLTSPVVNNDSISDKLKSNGYSPCAPLLSEFDSTSDECLIEHPSDPPSYDISELSNLKRKQILIRKIYLTFFAQWTLFSILCLIFVKVPYLARLIRKNVFDKIFFLSIFSIGGFALFCLPLFFFYFRRKCAIFALSSVTVFLAMIFSYALSYTTAKLLFFSNLFIEFLCLGISGATFIPKIDLSSKNYFFFVPLYMLSTGATIPKITGSNWSNTLPVSTFSTIMMSYLAYNVGSIVNDRELNVQTNEYFFAAIQAYLNFDIKKVKNILKLK